MRVTIRGLETERSLLAIAEGLRVSARVHKNAIRSHREALQAVMTALAELESVIETYENSGVAEGETHGRSK